MEERLSKNMKDKIRPIYSELQGYLSQAPEATSGRERIYDDTSLVDQLNSSIQVRQQPLISVLDIHSVVLAC